MNIQEFKELLNWINRIKSGNYKETDVSQETILNNFRKIGKIRFEAQKPKLLDYHQYLEKHDDSLLYIGFNKFFASMNGIQNFCDSHATRDIHDKIFNFKQGTDRFKFGVESVKENLPTLKEFVRWGQSNPQYGKEIETIFKKDQKSFKEINNHLARKQFFLERKYVNERFFTPFSHSGPKHQNNAVAPAYSNKKDETKLLAAALNNDYDKAKKLLANGIKPDFYNAFKNHTPLQLAIIHGSIDVVALFLLNNVQLHWMTENYAKLSEGSFNIHDNAVLKNPVSKQKNATLQLLLSSKQLPEAGQKHVETAEKSFTQYSSKP
jgi:hypothetical protein